MKHPQSSVASLQAPPASLPAVSGGCHTTIVIPSGCPCSNQSAAHGVRATLHCHCGTPRAAGSCCWWCLALGLLWWFKAPGAFGFYHADVTFEAVGLKPLLVVLWGTGHEAGTIRPNCVLQLVQCHIPGLDDSGSNCRRHAASSSSNSSRWGFMLGSQTICCCSTYAAAT